MNTQSTHKVKLKGRDDDTFFCSFTITPPSITSFHSQLFHVVFFCFFSSRVDWRDKRCFLWKLSKLLGDFLSPYIFPLPHLNKWVSFLLWSLLMAVTSICLEWSFTGVQSAAIVCFCLCWVKTLEKASFFLVGGCYSWVKTLRLHLP